MAAITVFCYDRCTTCIKARKWLDSHSVKVNLRPIVDQPPTLAEMRDLWKRSGLPIKRFFNTSGGSYRALPNRDQLDSLPDATKLELLSRDGKLIKRPILDDGKTVLVGFDADEYAAWRGAR